MSGGSYDYAYCKIQDLAQDIRPTTPLRKAFKKRLKLVSDACREIEWVDSGDSSPGDVEDHLIRAALGADADRLALKEIAEEAKKISGELNAALEKVEKQK